MKEKKQYKHFFYYTRTIVACLLVLGQCLWLPAPVSAQLRSDCISVKVDSGEQNSFIDSVEQESLSTVLPDMGEQEKDARYRETLAAHLAALREKKDAQVSETIHEAAFQKECEQAMVAAEHLVDNNEILIPVSLTEKRSLKEMLATLAKKRSEIGVGTFADIVKIVQSYLSQPWDITFLTPENGMQEFAIYENGYLIREPVFVEEGGKGLRVTVAYPQWQHLTNGERVAQILGACVEYHYRDAAYDEAISGLCTPAFEAGADETHMSDELIAAVAAYDRIKLDMLFAVQAKDTGRYGKEREKLIKEIRAINKQVQTLSPGAMAVVCERAQQELVKALSSKERERITMLAKDLSATFKLTSPQMYRQFETFFAGSPGKFIGFLLGNPREFHTLAGVPFPKEQQEIIDAVIDETVRELYDDKKQQDEARTRIHADVVPWDIAYVLPEVGDLHDAQQAVNAAYGFLELFRMQYAAAYFDARTEKLYFPHFTDMLDLRRNFKHELVHYLAFRHELKFDHSFEWTTCCIHVLEVAEQLGAAKLGLYSDHLGPVVTTLFKRGVEIAEKGEQGLLIETTAEGPTVSLEYLSAVVADVYNKAGLSADALRYEDGWDREIGSVLAGIMYARRHYHHVDTPYLRVLQDFFAVIHEQLRPPAAEEQAWIDKTLMPKLASFARFQLGDVAMRPVSDDAPIKQWSVTKVGNRHEITYVPQDTWPRDYYGGDEKARNQKAEDHAFAALSEALFRYQYSMKDQALAMATSSGLDEEERFLFENLWKTLETYDVVQKGVAIYKGVELDGDDLRSQKAAGFSAFTSARIGEQIFERFKTAYDIKNIDVEQTILAGKPLPVQFLNSLMYRRVLGTDTDPRLTRPRVEKALEETRAAWYGLTSGTTWTDINEIYNTVYTRIWPVFKALYDEAVREEENKRVYDRLRRDNARGDEPEWDDLTDAQKQQMQDAIKEALEQMTDDERAALQEAVQEYMQQQMQEQGAQTSGEQGSSQPQTGGTPQAQPGGTQGGMAMPNMPQSAGDLKDRLDEMQAQTKNLEEALSEMQEDITRMGRDTSQVGKEAGSMSGKISDEQQQRAGRIADGTNDLKESAGELKNSSDDIDQEAQAIKDAAQENVSKTPSVELGEKSAKEAGKLTDTTEALTEKTEKLDGRMQELKDQADALKKHIEEKEEASTIQQHLDKLKEMLAKAQSDINDVSQQAQKTFEQSGDLENALGKQEQSKPLTSDFPSMKKEAVPADRQEGSGEKDEGRKTEEAGVDATPGVTEEKPRSFEDMIKATEAMDEDYKPKEDGTFDGFTEDDFTFDFDDMNFEQRQETTVTPGTEDLPQGWKDELNTFFARVRKDINDITARIAKVLSPDARSGLAGGFMEGADIDDLVDIMTTGEGWAQPAHDQPEDMVVSLFLDLSGSMAAWGGGTPIGQARYAALILTKALFELKHKFQQFDVSVRFEVWGFGEYDRPLMSFSHADKITPEMVNAALYRLYKKIKANDNDTLDREALERQYDNLRSYAASGVKRVGFFVTDGNSGKNVAAMRTIVEKADTEDDIQLFGLSVGNADSKRIVKSIFQKHAIPVKTGFKDLGLAIVNTLFNLSGTTDADYSWMELCMSPTLPITKALIRAGVMLHDRLLLVTKLQIPVAPPEEDIPGYEEFGFKYRLENGMKYLMHYGKDSAGNRTILDFKMRLGHTGDFKPSFLPYSQTNEAYLLEIFRESQKGAGADLAFDSDQENPRVSKDGKRFIREIPTGGLELWDADKRQMIVSLDKKKDFTEDPLWPKPDGQVLNGQAKNGNLYLLTATATGGLSLIVYEKGKKATWEKAEEFTFEDKSPNGRLVNLMGESGTGKGELLKAAACLAQKRLVFVSCHKDMNRGDIVYYAAYGEEQDNATGKKYSHLNKGVQMGDWVVLDEFNKIPTNVRKELQTSFQERTYERDIETIGADGSKTIKAVSYRWHPDARVFLTGNPFDDGRLYKVNKYDDAELRRMDTIEIKWQSPEEELHMLTELAFPKGARIAEKKKWLNDFKFLVWWSMTTRLQYLGYDDDARKELLQDWKKFKNPHRYGIQPAARKGDIVGRPISTRIMIRMAQAMVREPDFFRNRPVSFMKRFFSYAADDQNVCTPEMYENIFRVFEGKYRDTVDANGNGIAPRLAWGKGVSVAEDKGQLILTIAPPETTYTDAEGKTQHATWDAITIELHPSVTKGMVEERVKQAFSNPANGAIFYEILMQYALGNHMCFVGAPGTGKSYFAEIAQKMLSGPEAMNGIFARGTKYQDVVEQREIGQQKKGKTGWIRRPLIWAMGDKKAAKRDAEYRGQIYRAEELNQGPAMLHALFNDILQNGRILLRDETEVEAGDGFRIVITMNPPGKKTQVNPLSGELIDRLVFFEFADMQPEFEVYEYTQAVKNKLDQNFLGVFKDGEVTAGLIKVVTFLREEYDKDPSILSARPAISDIIPYVQYVLQYYPVTSEEEKPYMLIEEFIRAIHADMNEHFDFIKKAFIDAGILKEEKGVLKFDRKGLLGGRPLIAENLGIIREPNTGDDAIDSSLRNLQNTVTGAPVEWAEDIASCVHGRTELVRSYINTDWNEIRDGMAMLIEIHQVLNVIQENRKHSAAVAQVLSMTHGMIEEIFKKNNFDNTILECETGFFKEQQMQTILTMDDELRLLWLKIQILTAAQKYDIAAQQLNALMEKLLERTADMDTKLLHESVRTLWFMQQIKNWLDDAKGWRLKKLTAVSPALTENLAAVNERLVRARGKTVTVKVTDIAYVGECIDKFQHGPVDHALVEQVLKHKDLFMDVYANRCDFTVTADEEHMNEWVQFLDGLYHTWQKACEMTVQPEEAAEKEKKIAATEEALEALRVRLQQIENESGEKPESVSGPLYPDAAVMRSFISKTDSHDMHVYLVSKEGKRYFVDSRDQSQLLWYRKDGTFENRGVVFQDALKMNDMAYCPDFHGKEVFFVATPKGIRLFHFGHDNELAGYFPKEGLATDKAFSKLAVHQAAGGDVVIYAYCNEEGKIYKSDEKQNMTEFENLVVDAEEPGPEVDCLYCNEDGELFVLYDGFVVCTTEKMMSDSTLKATDMIQGRDGYYYFIIDGAVYVKKRLLSEDIASFGDVEHIQNPITKGGVKKATKLQEYADGLNILWDDGSITIVPPANGQPKIVSSEPWYTKDVQPEAAFKKLSGVKNFLVTEKNEYEVISTNDQWSKVAADGTLQDYDVECNDFSYGEDLYGAPVYFLAQNDGVDVQTTDPKVKKIFMDTGKLFEGKRITHVTHGFDENGDVVVYAYAADEQKIYRADMNGIAEVVKKGAPVPLSDTKRLYCDTTGRLFVVAAGSIFYLENKSFVDIERYTHVSDIIQAQDGYYYFVSNGVVFVYRGIIQNGVFTLEDVDPNGFTVVAERLKTDNVRVRKLYESEKGLNILWDDGSVTIVPPAKPQQKAPYETVIKPTDVLKNAAAFAIDQTTGVRHVVSSDKTDIIRYSADGNEKETMGMLVTVNDITIFSYRGKEVRVEAMNSGITITEWSAEDNDWVPSEDVTHGSKDNEFFKGKKVTQVERVVVNGDPYIYAYMPDEGRIGVIKKAKNGRFVEVALADGGFFDALGTDISDIAFVGDDTAEYYISFGKEIAVCDPSQNRFYVMHQRDQQQGTITGMDVTEMNGITYVALVIDGEVYRRVRKNDTLVNLDGDKTILPLPQGEKAQHVDHYDGEWNVLLDDGSVVAVPLMGQESLKSPRYQESSSVRDVYSMPGNFVGGATSFALKVTDGSAAPSVDFVFQKTLGLSIPTEIEKGHWLLYGDYLPFHDVEVFYHKGERFILAATDNGIEVLHGEVGALTRDEEFGEKGVLFAGKSISKVFLRFDDTGELKYVFAISAKNKKAYVGYDLHSGLSVSVNALDLFERYGTDVTGYYVGDDYEIFVIKDKICFLSTRVWTQEFLGNPTIRDMIKGRDGYYYFITNDTIQVKELRDDEEGEKRFFDVDGMASPVIASFAGEEPVKLREYADGLYVLFENGAMKKIEPVGYSRENEKRMAANKVQEIKKQIVAKEAELAALKNEEMASEDQMNRKVTNSEAVRFVQDELLEKTLRGKFGGSTVYTTYTYYGDGGLHIVVGYWGGHVLEVAQTPDGWDIVYCKGAEDKTPDVNKGNNLAQFVDGKFGTATALAVFTYEHDDGVRVVFGYYDGHALEVRRTKSGWKVVYFNSEVNDKPEINRGDNLAQYIDMKYGTEDIRTLYGYQRPRGLHVIAGYRDGEAYELVKTKKGWEEVYFREKEEPTSAVRTSVRPLNKPTINKGNNLARYVDGAFGEHFIQTTYDYQGQNGLHLFLGYEHGEALELVQTKSGWRIVCSKEQTTRKAKRKTAKDIASLIGGECIVTAAFEYQADGGLHLVLGCQSEHPIELLRTKTGWEKIYFNSGKADAPEINEGNNSAQYIDAYDANAVQMLSGYEDASGLQGIVGYKNGTVLVRNLSARSEESPEETKRREAVRAKWAEGETRAKIKETPFESDTMTAADATITEANIPAKAMAEAKAAITEKSFEPIDERRFDLAEVEATLSGHKGSVSSLTVLNDGRLASGSEDGIIKIWDLENKQVFTLSGHEKGVLSLTILNDGRLASGSDDGIIKIWDLENKQVFTLSGHKEGVYSLTVLNDGRLASGSWDNTIKIWDLENKQVTTLTGHTNYVSSLTVLNDGRLASGSWDKTIKIWDLENKKVFTLSGHENSVSSLTVLNDGRLASGSDDGIIKIWDLGIAVKKEAGEKEAAGIDAEIKATEKEIAALKEKLAAQDPEVLLKKKEAELAVVEAQLKSVGAQQHAVSETDSIAGPWYRDEATSYDYFKEKTADDFEAFAINPQTGDRVFYGSGVKYDKEGDRKNTSMFHMSGVSINDVAYGSNVNGQTVQFRATDKGVIAVLEDEDGNDTGLDHEFGSGGIAAPDKEFTKITVHETGAGYPVIYAYCEKEGIFYRIDEKQELSEYVRLGDSGKKIESLYCNKDGDVFACFDGLPVYVEKGVYSVVANDADFSDMICGRDGYYYFIVAGDVQVRRIEKETMKGGGSRIYFLDLPKYKNVVTKDSKKKAMKLQESADGLNVLWDDGSITVVPPEKGFTARGPRFTNDSKRNEEFLADEVKKDLGAGARRLFIDQRDGTQYITTVDKKSVVLCTKDGTYADTIRCDNANVEGVYVHTENTTGITRVFVATETGIQVRIKEGNGWGYDTSFGEKGIIGKIINWGGGVCVVEEKGKIVVYGASRFLEKLYRCADRKTTDAFERIEYVNGLSVDREGRIVVAHDKAISLIENGRVIATSKDYPEIDGACQAFQDENGYYYVVGYNGHSVLVLSYDGTKEGEEKFTKVGDPIEFGKEEVSGISGYKGKLYVALRSGNVVECEQSPAYTKAGAAGKKEIQEYGKRAATLKAEIVALKKLVAGKKKPKLNMPDVSPLLYHAFGCMSAQARNDADGVAVHKEQFDTAYRVLENKFGSAMNMYETMFKDIVSLKVPEKKIRTGDVADVRQSLAAA